jgi:hypothetical protein
MSVHSPEHLEYLQQIGIAERPLTSSIAPKQRRKRPSGRAGQVIGIFGEADLLKLRGLVSWRFHDNETREGRNRLRDAGTSHRRTS